jgi:hypothetical protein
MFQRIKYIIAGNPRIYNKRNKTYDQYPRAWKHLRSYDGRWSNSPSFIRFDHIDPETRKNFICLSPIQITNLKI